MKNNVHSYSDELGGLCALHRSNLVELHITRFCTFVIPFENSKLPPVQSVATSAKGASSITALVALQRQYLMPHLLQDEVGLFAKRLEEAHEIPEAAGWLTEVLSGGTTSSMFLETFQLPPLQCQEEKSQSV